MHILSLIMAKLECKWKYLFQDMQSGQKLWEEAVALYERATSTFLKNNLLLHFSYADFEEVVRLCYFVIFSWCIFCLT